MATQSGQGTTFNLPNYSGELFQISPADTPLVSAIGGLTGGHTTTSTEYQWQTESLESTSANNSKKEGQAAPTASEQSRTNVKNVVEIHQEAVEVSYTKQAAVGQLSGLNTADGANPVQDELTHQINLKLKKVAIDVEKSFISGVYQLPTDNTTERKTRGILSAITTNAFTAASLTKAAVDDALAAMYDGGAPLDLANTVLIMPALTKVALTNVYSAAGLNQPPMSRNVGGVNIQTLVTDFGTFGVMIDRWMPAGVIGILDLSVMAPVFLTVPGKGHLFAEPLAKTGASDKYQLYGEIGLEYGPESYHGKLTITDEQSSSSSSSSST